MAKQLNIRPLEPGKFKVKFKYTCPLSGLVKTHRETVHGSLQDAMIARDAAKARLRRQGVQARQEARASDLLDSFLTARTQQGKGRRKKKMRRATLERDALILDMHILPEIGDWILGRITLADLDALVSRWLEKPVTRLCQKTNRRISMNRLYAPATINGWIKVLKLFLRHGYQRLGLGQSPADDLELVAETPRQVAGLTYEQAQRFLAHARTQCPWLYALFYLAILTTQRFSTLTALHVDEISYRQDLVMAYSQNEGVRVLGDKEGKIHRFPMLDELADVLQWHMRYMLTSKHCGWSSGILFPARVNDASEAAYNGYLCRSGVNKWVKRIGREVGIPGTVTFHRLRHTGNTWLLATGVSGDLVRAIVGHDTEEMTAHYAQHIPMETRRALLSPIASKLTAGIEGVQQGVQEMPYT